MSVPEGEPVHSMGRARVMAIVAAALAASGCGQTPAAPTQPATVANSAASEPAANIAAPPTLVAAPQDDRRPDKAKLEDFTDRVAAEQDAVLAADAAMLRDARAALQAGSQDRAKAALTRYLAAIGGQMAATPQVPSLSSCYARARAPTEDAATSTTAMLADRRDKAQAITATTFRPWTLPDFGALAGDVSSGPQAADAVRASLAKAKAAMAACRTVASAPVRIATSSAASEARSGGGAAAPSEAPVITPAAPASQAAASPTSSQNGQQTAQPRKPGFFDRLRQAFH